MTDRASARRSEEAARAAAAEVRLRASGVCKSFTLHAQGVTLPVLRDAAVTARRGACVALTGASGAGKSTLLRLLYGNYRIDRGRVAVRHGDGWIDLATAEPHEVLEARRLSLGYVSQFLRVIPRVPALSIVAEPMIAAGSAPEAAEARAAELLSRLRIPERLWPLSPLTFSGGEQQRVNIARGLAHSYPLLLLDEPTASLDAANRETALDLIEAAKARGAALVGIFHDAGARERLADETVDVAAFAA